MKIRRPVICICLLPLLLGIALRVFMISQLHAPWGDNGAAILDVAKNIVKGRGYSTQRIWTFYGPAEEFGQPEGNRQPLLPLLEAGTRLFIGSSYRSAQLVPFVIGLAVICLMGLIGYHVGGLPGGTLAALFSALDPLHIYFSSQIEDQILFLALFLVLVLWMLKSRDDDTSPGHVFIPGIILAALYLTRTNGFLMLIAYVLISWYRGRIKHALATVGIFIIISIPWFIRNILSFGNPFHTDNAYFLWSDQFSDVFSVRDEAPSFTGYLETHSIFHMTVRWVKGAYLCLEGFFLGNVHRGEPFAAAPLTLPLLLAIPGFKDKRYRTVLLFATVSFGLHFVTLSWHAHGTYRYFLPFYAIILCGAAAGISQLWQKYMYSYSPSIRWLAGSLLVLLLLLPQIRPLWSTLGNSDIETHVDAMEIVEWLKEEAPDSTVVMDFPIIEKYVYDYDLPTMITPHDSISTIWSVAREHGATHLVVCADQIRLVPALGELWRVKDEAVIERTIPKFLRPIMESGNDRFLLYEFDWTEKEVNGTY